ncbi:hypothetical protein B9Z19DRAFT_711178 [Tuber borchii]|uniref:Uncharacterized protein n=1 Tax=Tuber borchii TaxID=42251 RepID=A0A2T6ZYV0_TUBBO|nr:hypothetical protein B9Z19DRAFT_711178 [Tuber borchii]
MMMVVVVVVGGMLACFASTGLWYLCYAWSCFYAASKVLRPIIPEIAMEVWYLWNLHCGFLLQQVNRCSTVLYLVNKSPAIRSVLVWCCTVNRQTAFFKKKIKNQNRNTLKKERERGN